MQNRSSQTERQQWSSPQSQESGADQDLFFRTSAFLRPWFKAASIGRLRSSTLAHSLQNARRILVDLTLMSRAHAVRRAWIDLQRRVLTIFKGTGRGVLGANGTPKAHNHKRCPDVDARQLAHRCIPKDHRREFFGPDARRIFGEYLDCTGSDLEKLKRRQSNQYATGSELVESFFHLGFKAACKHEDAVTPALPQPDVNRWLRYVGRTFFNFPRHRKFVWCRFREQT